MKNTTITLVLCLFLASCAQNEQGYEKKFSEAYYNNSLPQLREALSQCETKSCLGLGEYYLSACFNERKMYDSALIYAAKSYVNFETIEDRGKLINLNWLSGYTLSLAGDNRSSITLYKSALGLTDLSDEDKEMRVKLDMAKSYYFLGDYSEANKLLNLTLDYFKGKDQVKYADSHLVLGNIKSDFEETKQKPNYEEALDHLSTALKLYEDEDLKSQALNAIGWLYLQDDQLTKAELYLDSAYLLQSDSSVLAGIALNNARLNQKKGNTEQSIKAFNQVLALSDDLSLESIESYSELILYNTRSDEAKKTIENLVFDYKNKSESQVQQMNDVTKLALSLLYQSTVSQEKLIKSIEVNKLYEIIGLLLIVIALILISGIVYVYYFKLKPALKNANELKVRAEIFKKDTFQSKPLQNLDITSL